jgi:hypothetical protein
MKKHLFLTAIFTLSLVPFATTGRAQAPIIKLHHRSEFRDEGLRNPLWPIGWQKPEKGVEIVSNEPQMPVGPEQFSVTSISISSTPLTVINGRTYAEGETINAIFNGQRLKILVVQITDGGVVLQYLGKKFTVNQKRLDALPKESTLKADEPHDNAIILH